MKWLKNVGQKKQIAKDQTTKSIARQESSTIARNRVGPTMQHETTKWFALYGLAHQAIPCRLLAQLAKQHSWPLNNDGYYSIPLDQAKTMVIKILNIAKPGGFVGSNDQPLVAAKGLVILFVYAENSDHLDTGFNQFLDVVALLKQAFGSMVLATSPVQPFESDERFQQWCDVQKNKLIQLRAHV